MLGCHFLLLFWSSVLRGLLPLIALVFRRPGVLWLGLVIIFGLVGRGEVERSDELAQAVADGGAHAFGIAVLGNDDFGVDADPDVAGLADAHGGGQEAEGLEVSFHRPVPLVPVKTLPGETREQTLGGRIAKLRHYAASSDPKSGAFALFRAGRIAEEELKDLKLAAELYDAASAVVPAGRIHEAAKEGAARVRK